LTFTGKNIQLFGFSGCRWMKRCSPQVPKAMKIASRKLLLVVIVAAVPEWCFCQEQNITLVAFTDGSFGCPGENVRCTSFCERQSLIGMVIDTCIGSECFCMGNMTKEDVLNSPPYRDFIKM
ncbi:hypothetical protein HPB47_028385, partial [Ixodes persulcatus]